jgi:hypothetical protein
MRFKALMHNPGGKLRRKGVYRPPICPVGGQKAMPGAVSALLAEIVSE